MCGSTTPGQWKARVTGPGFRPLVVCRRAARLGTFGQTCGSGEGATGSTRRPMYMLCAVDTTSRLAPIGHGQVHNCLDLGHGAWLAPFPSAMLRVIAVLAGDRKSTRLNSSHSQISYAVF